MKKKKERILGTPKKRGKFFTFFKGFLRIFTRKPKIINLNDKIEDRANISVQSQRQQRALHPRNVFSQIFRPLGHL